MLRDLIPALSVTVAPATGLLVFAYAMRGGPTSRRCWSPHAVPAAEILRRLGRPTNTKEAARRRRDHVWTVVCDECRRPRSWCGCPEVAA